MLHGDDGGDDDGDDGGDDGGDDDGDDDGNKQMFGESGLYGALWRRRSPGNNDNEHFQETFPHTHPHPLFDQEHHLNITG